MNQADVFYQALLARDYRFDGKFFVAVKTTGVYCRPICPAKPKRENVEFYLSAAAAEKSGYRPCLRCRPESAPLSPAWFGTSAIVGRALKLISANRFQPFNEDSFAEQFGVSARHLRRLFEDEIGQTPKQISSNNRLGFARKLVVETRLPMTAVADTAGFSSLRRFNDAFKKRFHRAPLQVRKGAKHDASRDTLIELSLAYRPPYDWATILNFFRSHQVPGVENIGEDSYERIFKIKGEVGWFRVEPVEGKSFLKLKIAVENPRVLFDVVGRVRHMFDLDSDPLLIANSFARSKVLSRIHDQYPGLRLPRGWEAYETAICAILGQVVSVEQARRLIGQLIASYGEVVEHPLSGEKVKVFPSAKILARALLDEVRTTEARRVSIRELSQKILAGKIEFSDTQDPVEFRRRLQNIKGIGPWSAEYISLRAIGDTDAFPATDLILRRALQLHHDLDLEHVRPWRSYAAIYLWKAYAKTLSKRTGAIK